MFSTHIVTLGRRLQCEFVCYFNIDDDDDCIYDDNNVEEYIYMYLRM